MTPIKEIGECLITVGDDDYFFRPSLGNMTRIGEPQDIVQAFYDVHNDSVTPLIKRAIAAYGRVPDWVIHHVNRPEFSKRTMLAAMGIMQSCCDRDISVLTGDIVPSKTGRRAFVWRAGVMPVTDIVLIAQSLIQHGIIGKAKVRKLQRHESSQGSNDFSAYEYISAARTHLGVSRDEAQNLTMTEFQQLLAAKYPEQKGFTKEEYDSVADDYLAKKARKLAKSA